MTNKQEEKRGGAAIQRKADKNNDKPPVSITEAAAVKKSKESGVVAVAAVRQQFRALVEAAANQDAAYAAVRKGLQAISVSGKTTRSGNAAWKGKGLLASVRNFSQHV